MEVTSLGSLCGGFVHEAVGYLLLQLVVQWRYVFVGELIPPVRQEASMVTAGSFGNIGVCAM